MSRCLYRKTNTIVYLYHIAVSYAQTRRERQMENAGYACIMKASLLSEVVNYLKANRHSSQEFIKNFTCLEFLLPSLSLSFTTTEVKTFKVIKYFQTKTSSFKITVVSNFISHNNGISTIILFSYETNRL